MKIVALFIVSLLIGSQALESTLMNKLTKLGDMSEFGAYITNLVQVHLEQNNGKHFDFIDKILDGLLKQQAIDDLRNSQKIARYESTLSNLEHSIDNLASDLSVTNRLVGDLVEDIVSLSQTVVSSSKQLSVLNDRVQALSEERTLENGEYQRKLNSINRMYNAVLVLHKKLSSLVHNGGSLIEEQRKELIHSIKKEFGSKHPIALMVEMTSRFDTPSAIKVILRLEAINKNLDAQIEDIEQDEQVAQSTYNTISGQLNEVVDRFSADLQQSKQTLATKRNDLVIAQRRSREITQELYTNDSLLISTRESRTISQSNYQLRTNDRQKQISVISTALDVLQQGSNENQ